MTGGNHQPDPRLDEAHSLPIAEVVERLEIVGLNRTGGELVGPCPDCGGTDRFGVNLQRNVFNCRRCGAAGDQVALVRHVLRLDFRAALDWLCGPVEELTQAERDRRAQKSRDHRERQARIAAQKRIEAMSLAMDIWRRAQPAEGTPVRDYLARRGVPPHLFAAMPDCLRYMALCPYTVPVSGQAGKWRTIHAGPAMIAAVQSPDGRIAAVHRTWLDLDQPGGKAALTDPQGEIPADRLPVKKVLGSKKGGAIRLRSPRDATTLYMGEGIETTLSALIAEDPPMRAAFWAGVDLGNMAGRRQRGTGLKYAGLPDLDDGEAFVPPPQIRHLVYIQDGDSDPRLTRAQLEAGLRRAMALRPGLTGAIVHAGQGRDLNDLLRGGA